MNESFYTAALGARSQQVRLDVMSNNIANVNTTGYKSKNPVFAELMYYEMKGKADPDNRLHTGTGVRVESTETNFANSSLTSTNAAYDYGIAGDGFFMLRNPQTQEITYTREGSFRLSQQGNDFYLTNADGKLVLDRNQNPIIVTADSPEILDIGIFDFANKNGMLSVGDSEFVPVEKNGNVLLAGDSELQKGVIESSNVNFANEMTKVIEAQRAYTYALRMVKTTDEIESTINSLR